MATRCTEAVSFEIPSRRTKLDNILSILHCITHSQPTSWINRWRQEMMDPILLKYEVTCIVLLCLGLKFFYPKNPWVWWVALFVGIYAGWGVWILEGRTTPLLAILRILIRNEAYQLLLDLSIGFLSAVATALIPTLAVLTFMKRLFR